jgi:hypothetical protein
MRSQVGSLDYVGHDRFPILVLPSSYGSEARPAPVPPVLSRREGNI